MSSEAFILEQISQITDQLQDNPDDAELIHDLGVGYLLLGKYEESIEILRKAVSLSPGDKTYLYNLGNALAEAESYLKAIEIFYQVLDIDAAHIPALNNLADCYEKAGDSEKAFEIFDYITRIAPDNALSFFNLGNFLLRNNRHIEAVKCYALAIDIEAGFTDAYHNIAWILSEANALKEAEEYALKGLETDAENEDLIELLRKIRN